MSRLEAPRHNAAWLAAGVRSRGANITPDGRVSEAEAARVLGVSKRTLQRWREAGRGPAFFHLERRGSVTYRLVDLTAFVEAWRIDPATGATRSD